MSLVAVLRGEIYGIWESCIQFFSLLCQSISSDRLEGDVDVDAFLGRCFKVGNIVLRLAPLLGSFRWNLQDWEANVSKVEAGHSISILQTYSSILQIDLIAQNYEREMLRIARTGLDQELVTPRVEIFECVGCSCVEDQNTAISSTIECNSKWLETFWKFEWFTRMFLISAVPSSSFRIYQYKFQNIYLVRLCPKSTAATTTMYGGRNETWNRSWVFFADVC